MKRLIKYLRLLLQKKPKGLELYMADENRNTAGSIGSAVGIYLDNKKICDSNPIDFPCPQIWTVTTTGSQGRPNHIRPSLSLQQQLAEAIEIEDYETAARIRDRINESK